MANAQLKAICPLKYPVLLLFSVATAVGSLPRAPQRRARGQEASGSARARPGEAHPHLATPPLPLATCPGLSQSNASCFA